MRSPALWKTAKDQGWHPVQRHEQGLQFRPAGYRDFHRADSLVSKPGEAWIGTGVAFKTKRARRAATLAVVWEQGQDKPWVLLTDLKPADVGLRWYGLRCWIECGFRILKGLGWQWQKSQRTDPDRVARHWLVMAVATTWVLATGTRGEDATALGRLPAHLHVPPAAPAAPVNRRTLSVFQLGLRALQEQLHGTGLWRCLWLAPEPWPQDPPGLSVTRHEGVEEAA